MSRYLVMDVELIGRKEHGTRMKWKSFKLLTGALDVVEPETEPEFLSQPLTKDKISYGEIRKGQRAFPCQHGVHPLRLRIDFDRTNTVNIPLANFSELLTRE